MYLQILLNLKVLLKNFFQQQHWDFIEVKELVIQVLFQQE